MRQSAFENMKNLIRDAMNSKDIKRENNTTDYYAEVDEIWDMVREYKRTKNNSNNLDNKDIGMKLIERMSRFNNTGISRFRNELK